MKHLWKFVQDESIEIADNVGGGELLIEKDITLSTNFATTERMEVISKGEWSSANICQIFLQVRSVTDIATGGGAEIETII